MWDETALFLKPLNNPNHDVLTAQQCTDHGLPAKYAGCVAVGGYYTSNNDLFTDTRFTTLDTSTYVHFLTSFALGIGDVECENRFMCMCTVSKDNYVRYLPFFRQGVGEYPMHFYDPIRNGFPRPQRRYTNFKILDGITGSSSFTFNLRCVVSNWRIFGTGNCSAQVYIAPALVSLLSNYTNASYNGYNGEFMIKLYWNCLIMGVITGQCSYEIYYVSPSGWQQYAYNDSFTSSFSGSRVTKIELYQKSSKDGNFYKRKDWSTGNSSDLSFSTSKVSGSGTYYFSNLEYPQSTKDILFD